MPPVTAEDQPTALVAAGAAGMWLKTQEAATWWDIIECLAAFLPGHDFAAVRAGVEMALVDAVARRMQLPLWKFFGGASNVLVTDITIPICTPLEAERLAAFYKQQGFAAVKTKVGGTALEDDIARLAAIREGHPECSLLLDANCGYTVSEAMAVLKSLHELNLDPILLEQPVPREDWSGLRQVALEAQRLYGISVAADESCRCFEDAQRIVEQGLAQVVNIKLAKVGVVGALKVARLVRGAGTELMIGGMVETRLAMGFSAHFAAGMGCFRYIDLDTPLLLAEDPVQGGYTAQGATYDLGNDFGHGASLSEWTNDS
eukprot:TRINITY_DN6848_c0_g1_i5.p1 TRINITY_DN6848_c0_g1~~TRINITY_DN6848_c0_g1_i5.p1  ORF type:complete len:317 (+),score=68.94 TRINITY_DN6848_c0_g1_i5:266-1216(+)